MNPIQSYAGADSNSRSLMENVDARTKLAGSNRMEILLFSLGTHETFGINVFKVREVCEAPEITRERLYLETMERVLGGTDKIILDSTGASGGGVVPYISLDELTKRANPSAQQQRSQSGANR